MNILKKTIVKDVITNIIYLILMIIYFICFNTQVITLEQTILTRYIDISSMTFLVIAIIMFEVGYIKNIYKWCRILSTSNSNIINKTYS